MDNFKAVYQILSSLEKAMDCPEFDLSQIDAKALGISEERWARYFEMMTDVDYIKGVKVFRSVTGNTVVQDQGVRITLKGLEYLQENSTMKKIYNMAKGIKEIVPGI
ncbi:MAG: YjcQ family protein [Eubacteriales bacterium]|nr:YjcQ family protein [Eubacteriales bacterium]